MKLSGSQIVIEELCRHGVDTIFGYPGGSVLPLYDELYKNSGRITHVLTAHEQGAAHAADGYARASGKTGVVFATSGPGATNLVTGIANAYLDSVPLVAITGNVSVPLLGRDTFQEVDILGVTLPVVKHSFMVRDIDYLEDVISEAFRIANSGRKGPVLVDIPKNIQVELAEYTGNGVDNHQQEEAITGIDEAVEAIKKSKRPFIYAGGGVCLSGAEDELFALSQMLNAPVGLSMMGLTALPSSYELNLGMCGMHGAYAASVAQDDCDLIIALGVKFSDRATGKTDAYKKGKAIIHFDIDLSEIGKNVEADLYVQGDLRLTLRSLLDKLPDMKNDEWLAHIGDLKRTQAGLTDDNFMPKQVIEAVNRHCEPNTVIATDVGQHQMWTMQYYAFSNPKTLLTSGGLGTMGYGLGAAIGGCMATGNQRTILFTSDGSFGMNLNELATAVTYNLPIVIILLNNGVLGMVRQWQTMFFDKRYSNTTLERKTDFAALAKAFGCEGYSISTIEELDKILDNLPDGPVVIDYRISKDELVLPMIPGGGTVKDIIVEAN